VVLLAAVLGLGSLARFVPLSCLAGILIKSGLDVVDWDLLKRIRLLPMAEVAILAVTFFMTVFVDLIVAVVAGWALAVGLLFFKTSMLQLSTKGVEVFDSTNSGKASQDVQQVLLSTNPSKVVVVQLKGQVGFGAAVGLLRQLVPRVVGCEKVFVELSEVAMIDTSVLLSLEELMGKITAEGGKTYICGANSGMDGIDLLKKVDLIKSAANGSVEDALSTLKQSA